MLERIEVALAAAREIFARFTPGKIETEYKSGHDPVTEADRALDAALRKNLLRDGEGWLSEESADDLSRLDRERVWVVDPLDGTREFVQGIPEFCVSIAMVERGRPVAAGICNPATNETFIGAVDCGLTYNGTPARASQQKELQRRWFLPAAVRPNAASGSNSKMPHSRFSPWVQWPTNWREWLPDLADITFTLTPKNEWDIAGGAALVASAGGFVQTLEFST